VERYKDYIALLKGLQERLQPVFFSEKWLPPAFSGRTGRNGAELDSLARSPEGFRAMARWLGHAELLDPYPGCGNDENSAWSGQEVRELMSRAEVADLLDPPAPAAARRARGRHEEAARAAMDRLDLAGLLSPLSGPQREIILDLVESGIADSAGRRLSLSGWMPFWTWDAGSVIGRFGMGRVSEALDALLEAREEIEDSLARRHLKEGDAAFLYLSVGSLDLSLPPDCGWLHKSGGRRLKAAADLRHDWARFLPELRPEILVASGPDGTPLAARGLPESRGLPEFLLSAADRLRRACGRLRTVAADNRGLLHESDLAALKAGGADWIAPVSPVDAWSLPGSETFTSKVRRRADLLELSGLARYPGERLIASRLPCFRHRAFLSDEKLAMQAESGFLQIRHRTWQGSLKTPEGIAQAVRKVQERHPFADRFTYSVREGRFYFRPDPDAPPPRRQLREVHVIRTSLPAGSPAASGFREILGRHAEIVAAFSGIMVPDFRKWPEGLTVDARVEARLLLAMLSHYVKRHMAEAWMGLRANGPGEEDLWMLEMCRGQDDPGLLKGYVNETAHASKIHWQTKEGVFVSVMSGLARNHACRRAAAPEGSSFSEDALALIRSMPQYAPPAPTERGLTQAQGKPAEGPEKPVKPPARQARPQAKNAKPQSRPAKP
jgi:hypothetical protein